MKRFEGKTVLVTGGAMGIGAATAERLAAEGCEVIIADKDEAAGRAIVSRLAGRGMPLSTWRARRRSRRWPRPWPRASVRLHGLVNSCGIKRTAAVAATDDTDWDPQVAINLRAPALCARALLPLLRKGPGHIVNLSSQGAFTLPRRESWVYDATKLGIVALTRNLASELAGLGIRVNSVAPGWTVTEMHFAGAPDPAARRKELEELDFNGALLKRLAQAPRDRRGHRLSPERRRLLHHGLDAARRRRRHGQLMAESDLYPPVRDWLAANGYTVRGEVRHCDVAAVRGDDLVAIELKRGLSLALLAQAARRQRHADSVYVAVPRPPNRARWMARSRDTLHLLRRLELGLLLVDARRVEVVLHPVAFERHRRNSERRAVLTEVAARSVDLNRGGSRGVPLVTAYREAAIRVACALAELGPSSPRQLRALGTGPAHPGHTVGQRLRLVRAGGQGSLPREPRRGGGAAGLPGPGSRGCARKSPGRALPGRGRGANVAPELERWVTFSLPFLSPSLSR